jgi:hypothetical protein
MTTTTPEHSVPAEKISGLIERVTFFNEENGFCVLRVRAKGHREEVTGRKRRNHLRNSDPRVLPLCQKASGS